MARNHSVFKHAHTDPHTSRWGGHRGGMVVFGFVNRCPLPALPLFLAHLFMVVNVSYLCVCLDVKLMNAGTCRSVDPYVGVAVIVYTLLMGSV